MSGWQIAGPFLVSDCGFGAHGMPLVARLNSPRNVLMYNLGEFLGRLAKITVFLKRLQAKHLVLEEARKLDCGCGLTT